MLECPIFKYWFLLCMMKLFKSFISTRSDKLPLEVAWVFQMYSQRSHKNYVIKMASFGKRSCNNIVNKCYYICEQLLKKQMYNGRN